MPRDVTWQPSDHTPARRKKQIRLLVLAVLIAANVGVILYHGDPRDRMPESALVGAERGKPRTGRTRRPVAGGKAALDVQAPGIVDEIDPRAGMRSPGVVQRVAVLSLKSGQTVAAALAAAHARPDEVQGALQALSGTVNFRRLRPGNVLKARFDASGRLLSLDVFASALERARATRTGEGWQAAPIPVEVKTVVAQVHGRVQSSLWDALTQGGESPALVGEVVDMFAWDIDFYTEVYPGDTFRLLVEKRYVDDELVGYGALLAGEFVSDGVPHLGFRFARADGGVGYFDEAGQSLKKQLLKSPLQYGHVTSGFGNRKHPILGYSRAHNGIDYGVPSGTPVWSVGDGKVVKAGYSNGYGKLVEVRHANGWLSQYAHLSQILVRAGQHVSQKEYIGKVGSTGLSTGPHLHYGLKRDGTFVSPLLQKFERGKPLAGAELERFRAEVARLLATLREIRIVQVGPLDERAG